MIIELFEDREVAEQGAIDAARFYPSASVRRAGYLLETFAGARLDALRAFVDPAAHEPAPHQAGGVRRGPVDQRWNLRLNTEIEPDAALAPRWRRFVAFLVEGYLLAGLALGAGLVVPDPGSRVVAIAFGAVSGLVLVATTGRTVGMWLFNMRVVVPPEVNPPGWRTAAVRFLVVNGPGFVVLALEPIVSTAVVRWLGLAGTLWLLACFGPILFDPWRRGLHDRAARTMVVYANSVAPLE